MTMLRGLVNYYDRVESTGIVAPPGYSREKISFAVLLASDGSVVDVDDLRDNSGKKPQPKQIRVPQPAKRTSGVAANFLWDKTAYVFGLSATSKRPADERKEFRSRHERILSGTTDQGLLALLAFLQNWDPSRFEALRHSTEMIDQNVVFRLDGSGVFLHELPEAKKIWAEHLSGASGDRGLCLVTGEEGPIARLHPAIKGVPGAQSSGASLVSFNLDAFTSYGKEQGANAPVSERAAHAYATALNTLLSLSQGLDPKTKRPRWKNRIQIGDATTIFWAEAMGGPKAIAAAGPAEDLVMLTFEPQEPSDEQEAAEVRSVLQQIEKGRPIEKIEGLKQKLKAETRFYVLGLSPNAARLSVRFFYETDLGVLIENMGQHWRDLKLGSATASRLPPSAYLLALQTAPMRRSEKRIVADAKKAPAPLIEELMRSIFEGRPYPYTLLATVLERLKADRIVTPLRVALVKASIVRRWRLIGPPPYGSVQETTLVALDPNHSSVGYQLGRLFALYERAQAACFDTINADVVDKFYASAVATPRYVFPSLNANFQNHRKKIEKGNNLAGWVAKRKQADPDYPRRLANSLNSRVGEIMSRFHPSAAAHEDMAGDTARSPIPAQLPIEEQGLFVIGYYHQKFFRPPGADTDQLPDDPDMTPSDTDSEETE